MQAQPAPNPPKAQYEVRTNPDDHGTPFYIVNPDHKLVLWLGSDGTLHIKIHEKLPTANGAIEIKSVKVEGEEW